MITMKFRQGFFDKEAVIRSVDAATRRVLSRFGAFVRTRARTSIRKRKRASAPGSPPSSHTGLLKRFLFFAWDPSKKSVVIGPERLNVTVDPNALPALEYGGAATLEEWKFVSGSKYGNRTQKIKKQRKIGVKARPFMGPALKAELPGLPAMWKDSVRK